MTRTAVLVSTPIKPDLAEAIAAGEAPRRDYLELRDMLDAKLISPPLTPGFLHNVLRRLGGHALAMAWVAWERRRDYDVILTDQEAVGLISALLFKLSHTRPGHVMISHYLTPAKKQILFRMLRVQTHINTTVCYSSAQERVARDNLRLRSDQVSLVLHPADSRFWRPAAGPEEALADQRLLRQADIVLPADTQVVCSAGLEFRDYPTLMEASRRLPESTKVVIATSSPWSKRKNTAEDVDLPHNVQRVALTPTQLRALYRRSQVVAIPLYDVDFQAGSLVAYEAMACGRPVVITRTRGQSDIVREGETGLYVSPGDGDGMSKALIHILSDSALSQRFGANARRLVEEKLNLDAYLAAMAELVRRVSAAHPKNGQMVGKHESLQEQVTR